jgi:hypothetical protein
MVVVPPFDVAEGFQTRRSSRDRSGRSSPRTLDPPIIILEQATGFRVFMLKAVLRGHGDEVSDLAKLICFVRREGLSALGDSLLSQTNGGRRTLLSRTGKTSPWPG